MAINKINYTRIFKKRWTQYGLTQQEIEVKCDQIVIRIVATCKKWSGQRGSNPRPSRWQRDALPLSYARN